MEDQDFDEYEQIASILPDELSLSAAFDGLILKESAKMTNPSSPFLEGFLSPNGDEINEQKLRSMQSDNVKQGQSFPESSGSVPVNSGTSYLQVPSQDFSVSASTFQQPCFLDMQTSSYMPYQSVNLSNMAWCNVKDDRFNSSQPHLYFQNLLDQGFEGQQLRITNNSAMGPFSGIPPQSYFQIPRWHQLGQANEVYNLNGSAFNVAYNQLDTSSLNRFLEGKQYHSKHDYCFFPQEQKLVSSCGISSPSREFLQHQNFSKVGRQIFPEKILTRSQGVNSIKTLVYDSVQTNRQPQPFNANNADAHSHFFGPNKSSVEGWNTCSSSPDTFEHKLASKFFDPRYDSVDDVAGIVYSMAKDQHGCHSLQRVLMAGTHEDIQQIFLAIIDHIVELMMDRFGNYVIQRLLDVCNEDQRKIIVDVITQTDGKLLVVSSNEHGTRAVQRVIETIKTPEQHSRIASALKPGIVSLMKHGEGNHVAESCLNFLSAEYKEFLFDAAVDNCIELAKDCQGCILLQKCLSKLDGGVKLMFLSHITLKAHDLSQDVYGNFVVQNILDQKIPWATTEILDRLKGYYQALSIQIHSSHVVEKCLKFAGDERRVEIIRELIAEPHFLQIMLDQYGNYVIQTAYKECKGAVRAAIVEAIRPHVQILRVSPFGKRVLSRTCLRR